MARRFPDPRLPDDRPPRASIRFGYLALAAMVLLTIVAYSSSFGILPASDDFPIVNEIHRGNQQGISSFFTDSVIRIGYRPLKSLSIWLCGRISPSHPMVVVRVMNLLAAAFYAWVALLWLRKMNLGWVGLLVAQFLMLLHPVMAAAIGSCDSIDALMSSALLWLGIWFIDAWAIRPLRAAACAIPCFILGVGFKENLFAMPLIAVAAIAILWPWARKRGIAIVGISLVLVSAAAIAIRFKVIQGGLSAGSEMIRIEPLVYAKNAAIFGTGLFYFGDTLWANTYVGEWMLPVGVVALASLTAVAAIVLGIVRQFRRDEFVAAPPVRGWVWFWLISLGLASFPTIVLYHVSEMYVPPMVLPFAMLCAISAEGWASMKRPKRILAGALAAVAVIACALAIRHKVDGLVDVGARSSNQLTQILNLLPDDAHDMKIAVIYDLTERQRLIERGEVARFLKYSVFAMGDEILLVHKGALDWVRPGTNLTFLTPDQDAKGFRNFDVSTPGLVVRWSYANRRFEKLNVDQARELLESLAKWAERIERGW